MAAFYSHVFVHDSTENKAEGGGRGQQHGWLDGSLWTLCVTPKRMNEQYSGYIISTGYTGGQAGT